MTNAEDRAAAYAVIRSQATNEEARGLPKPDSVLLLWFIRNVVGVPDIDAYDHVTDGDYDQGMDGLFLEPSAGDDDRETLVIYQSKYTTDPNSKVGPTDVDRLAGTVNHFETAATLKALLLGRLEISIRDFINENGILRKLEQDPDSIIVRVVLVTTGQLNPDAKRAVEALQATHGEAFIDVWDIDRLGPLAIAVRTPERMDGDIIIPYSPGELLVTGAKPKQVAVLPVKAVDVVAWDGIDDRTLFALNVRHQLSPNKVSKGLDQAIERGIDHIDFLAYHNGLTVICDSFEVGKDAVTVHRPSVANGAQSVLAFARGSVAGGLTDDLRVFAKLVEVAGRPTLEREVSRRSNTQTPVSARNLMANSGPQLRLQREFEDHYPRLFYETRPDTQTPAGVEVIRNDDAAQLLCAIYNEWPWLAVKRDMLFEAEHHPRIFGERIGAHHIVLADAIRAAVDEHADQFPTEYRTTWRLTRIVACYLVGQVARAAAAGPGKSVLDDPAAALADPKLSEKLGYWVGIAAAVLSQRNDALGEEDDYKREFKNQEKLLELRAEVRKTLRIAQLVPPPPD